MRRTLPLAVLLAVALAAVPTLGAPATSKTRIVGFPPYVLGTDLPRMLSADPELSLGDYPRWANTLVTRNYGRSIVAPIGGINYIALVGLQFWRGRLAVVVLKWPARSFRSVSAWRRGAADTQNWIMMRYALEAVSGYVASGPAWTIDMTDAAGNRLSAWSLEQPHEITMAYLWAPYAKALESAPAPEAGY